MILDTHTMIGHCLDNERTLENNGSSAGPGVRTPEMRAFSNLRNACEVFSTKSYGDFKKMHNDESKSRGFSAEYHGIKILTYYIAGRIMITVKNKDEDYITLVGSDEDSPNSMAGFHGIGCDVDVALDMLEIVTRGWWQIYHITNSEVITLFKTTDNLSIV